jgi:hypothetical protein
MLSCISGVKGVNPKPSLLLRALRSRVMAGDGPNWKASCVIFVAELGTLQELHPAVRVVSIPGFSGRRPQETHCSAHCK